MADSVIVRVPIQIREFEEADRAALRRLFLSARNDAFGWLPAGTHQLHDFDRSTEGERILTALIHDRLVGFASIWAPDRFLHCLFVDPAFQGCGAGKALLAGCAPYFNGVATLKCLQENRRAVRFYLSQGWRVQGEGDGADGAFWLMELPTPASGAG